MRPITTTEGSPAPPIPIRLPDPQEPAATVGAPLPVRHHDQFDGVLRVARISESTRVLGPGVRTVVWFQGCGLRCHGCTVPEAHAFGGGYRWKPEALARHLGRLDGLDGITLSGGEPSKQAAGVTRLILELRRLRPEWNVMAYTGHRRETLLRRGQPSQRELLEQIDILIDGPYIRSLACGFAWRGSSNQTVWALSSRGCDALRGRTDRWAGLEFEIGPEGLATTGVPAPGTDPMQALRDTGLELHRRLPPGVEAPAGDRPVTEQAQRPNMTSSAPRHPAPNTDSRSTS